MVKPIIIETQRFEDFRGWLSVSAEGFHVVQINQGFNKKAGTLRGLHFQDGEYAQAKLVSCLHGSIFNVAVDIRPGDEKWVDFFLRYWHKDCVCQYSMEAFTESYRRWCKRKNYKFRTDTAHKIYLLAQEGVATLPKCESTKMLITQACKSLNAVCEAKQSTQLEMQRLAAMLPEYEVVMQMEGAGPITGPALMAEIGDVRQFKNKKALVSFAGIDAPSFQSGAFESKSRHVSKRGSPHLRRTIFTVSNIILTRSNPENAVYCFMDKKRSEGKHYYVYTVAGSAKFLRVYYARVTEFLRSQPSSGAC